MTPVATTTLYDKIGGAPILESVVKEFFSQLIADDDLRVFFARTDAGKQTQSLFDFFSMALGGPNRYNGRPMKQAHANLGISERHFVRFTNHLAQTLRSAGVEQDDINGVIAAIAPLKRQIVEV